MCCCQSGHYPVFECSPSSWSPALQRFVTANTPLRLSAPKSALYFSRSISALHPTLYFFLLILSSFLPSEMVEVRPPLATAKRAAIEAAGEGKLPGREDEERLMRLLIAEDDKALALFLSRGLEADGHRVRLAFDGGAAVDAFREDLPDLTILDLNMPVKDGETALVEMRVMNADLPILILTGRQEVETRVRCLDRGADDLMLKPFSLHELRARCRALLRRKRDAKLKLHAGDLELDRLDHTASQSAAAEAIVLTNKEFALLEHLMLNRGQCVSRVELLDAVWNLEPAQTTNIVDVYINYLRRKLKDAPPGLLLHTVRGRGYMVPSEAELALILVRCQKRAAGNSLRLGSPMPINHRPLPLSLDFSGRQTHASARGFPQFPSTYPHPATHSPGHQRRPQFFASGWCIRSAACAGLCVRQRVAQRAWAQKAAGTSLEAVIVDSWLPDLDLAEFIADFRSSFPNVEILTADGTAQPDAPRGPYRQELLYAMRQCQDSDTAAWNTAPALAEAPSAVGITTKPWPVNSQTSPAGELKSNYAGDRSRGKALGMEVAASR